jgi:dienelactone hydrolase
MHLRTARVLAVAVTLAACGGESGPWYDTAPDGDVSYLPLGEFTYQQHGIGWRAAAGETIAVDAYLPEVDRAPVMVFLPGAAVVKERYAWVGHTLASHGIAVFVAQPPGTFASSELVTGTLQLLAQQNRMLTETASRSGAPAELALPRSLDLGRVLLAGHSAGGVPLAGLTDPGRCPPGFCVAGAAAPAALRGLVLLGFHMEVGDQREEPIAALEVPWLVLAGARDGVSTPEEVAATFARVQDRPAHLIEVAGMNHFQFADYVDPAADLLLDSDRRPTIDNRRARAVAATYMVRFARRTLLDDPLVPEDLGAGEDRAVRAEVRLPRVPARARDQLGGHGLPRILSERFGPPGLDGRADNGDVVATAEYRDARYLLVRNEATGAEVWRLTAAGVLEPVPFPGGQRAGFYGNRHLSGLLGAMAVHRGALWVGVSSGLQGGELGDSTGAELWRFDGSEWTPVISRQADADPLLQVQRTEGCAADDGAPGAVLHIAGAAFAPGELAGATLDDVGSPDAGEQPLVWSVLDNGESTLSVQSLARAGTREFTVCDRLRPGHRLFLRRGSDESGFGEPWNKAITALEVHEDRLYVGVGLNYQDGAELWVTDDGERFAVALPRSFWGRHADRTPRTSSITALHVSALGGATSTLLVAGTGTKGLGARLAALPAGGAPQFLIDDSVDGDDEGTDEAGLGTGNLQILSMATWRGRLWLSTFHLEQGTQLVSVDRLRGGTFRFELGPGAALPAGVGDPTQVAGRLFVVGDDLWLGTVAAVQQNAGLADTSALALRSRDGATWQLATAHAFGVNAVTVSQLFRFRGTVYAVAGNGALTERRALRPLQLYSLTEAPP